MRLRRECFYGCGQDRSITDISFSPRSHHKPTEAVYESLASLQPGRRTGQRCTTPAQSGFLLEALLWAPSTCLSSLFSCDLLHCEEEQPAFSHPTASCYESRRWHVPYASNFSVCIFFKRTNQFQMGRALYCVHPITQASTRKFQELWSEREAWWHKFTSYVWMPNNPRAINKKTSLTIKKWVFVTLENHSHTVQCHVTWVGNVTISNNYIFLQKHV